MKHSFLCMLRIFWTPCEATEVYTHGNQSFVFLDMPPWALLEWTERADLWKMQQNVHIDHCSQVSRLHRLSLLPIIHVFCCYTLCFSLPFNSAIQLWVKGTIISLWHALIQPLCLQECWNALICLREAGLYSGNKFLRGLQIIQKICSWRNQF